MQKTIIAAAVAGLLAMPAFAQTRVQLSGKINASWEWAQAKGANNSALNRKMRDRMTESGSEFHIKAFEDLGNGNQAFVDIQTAVDVFNGHTPAATPDAGRLASRRAAIGFSGKWGMLQLGKWDLHYNAQIWGGTGPNAALNQMYGAVSLLNQMGGRYYTTFGCRCNNTIRYVSPNFSGFQFALGYTRENEGTVDPSDRNKNDRGFSLQANYKLGGFKAMVAYWYRKDAAAGALSWDGGSFAAELRDEYSIRAGLAYTFDFGLTVGFTYDYGHMKHKAAGGGGSLKQHRNAFVIPVYYKFGPHQINAAFGWANDMSEIDDSGTKYYTVSYGYALSKRTTVYAGFARYSNDKNAAYDFWSNTAATDANALGADPTSFMVGMIHSF